MTSVRTFKLDKTLFNRSLYTSIFNFWFSGLPAQATAPSEASLQRWYGLGTSEAARKTFDGECRSRFLGALESLSPTKLRLPAFTTIEEDKREHYEAMAAPFTPEFSTASQVDNANAALALVLLLDQIPRNIFRNDQKKIYAHYDRLARAVQAAASARGLDSSPDSEWAKLPPRRTWFYMPLMHSEALADHEKFEASIAELLDVFKDDEGAVGYLEQSRAFETKHKNIIEKFGRYPYRNNVLGRKTTEDEKKWLEEGGETFGA